MITAEQMHAEHQITVTGGGPFGRAWFECSCGIERRFASKRAANVAASAHHTETTGAPASVTAGSSTAGHHPSRTTNQKRDSA